MNKVYKVLWNRSRACHVVTNETKKRRVKGKVRSVVDLVAPIALGGALATAAVLAPPVAAAPVNQTHIQVDSNWSHTQVSTNGNVHTITTDYAKDNIGINKFSDFELKAEHIANLKFKDGTNDLVNFVNNEIKIDGTVNAVKDNKIGGNLMFVSPSGMTVGSTGVINAGSFTAVAPSQESYDELSEIGSAGSMVNMDSNQYQKLQNAQVPINPNAIITISGNINAGNRITLASGKVHIEQSSRIVNNIQDFSQLVNIKNGDTVVTSAGLDAGELTLTPDTSSGSGDILLIARADTSAVSSASQNPTVTAEIKVNGTVQSRENITVQALAGNGTYDVDGTLDQTEDEGHFLVTGNHNLASINANVEIGGVLNAQKALDIDATAENRIDNSGGIRTAQGLTLEILGSTTPINEAVAYADLETNANVTVSDSAELTAVNDTLSVTANADTRVEIGTATSKIQLIDFIGNQTASHAIPSVAAVVGLVDSQAHVDISGDLSAGGDLTLQSNNNLEASLTATSSTYNSDHVQTAFTVGKFTGESAVTVDKNATVTLTGQAGTHDYTVGAFQTNKIETTAGAVARQNSYGGLAFNYTQLDTSSDMTIETGLTGVAKNAVFTSENNTQSFDVKADNAVNLPGILDKITSSVSSLSTNFLNSLFDKSWDSLNGSYSSPSVRLGGAVAVIKGEQASDLALNPAASSISSITAQNGMDITSRAQIWDHHFIANSSVRNEADSSGNHSALQGSLALLVQVPGDSENTISSNLTIGDGASLTVNAGNLTLTNEALIEYNRVQAMKNAFNQAIDDLEAIYESHDEVDSEFDQQWQRVQEQAQAMREAFDKVDSSDLSFTDSLGQLGTALGEFASTVTSFLQMAQPLAQTGVALADLGMSLFAFVQPVNYVNTSVSASGSGADGSWDAAGSVAILLQNTSSTLTVGKNVALKASNLGQAPSAEVLFGAVTIAGRSVNEAISLAGHIRSLFGITLPITTEANSVGGTLLYQSLGTDNQVLVGEGASIVGSDTSGIYATDGIVSVPIAAAADITKGSFGLDVMISISDVDAHNAISLDDEAKVEAPEILIDAARDDDIQTIAGAVDVGTGEGASVGVAAGVALNLGSLSNSLSIADNDLRLGDASLVSLTDGGLYASGDSITLTADSDLAMNAIGSALTAQISGTSDPDPDSNFTKILEFFSSIGDTFSQYGELAQNKISQLTDRLSNSGTTLGSGLRDKLFHTQDQNNSTSDTMAGNDQTNDQRFGSNGENGEVSNSTGVTEQNSAANSTEASHFQMGFAGSVGWNDLDSANALTIDVDNFTIDGDKTSIDAVTDKWVGAWAGSAAINFVKQKNDVNNSVSIAGAIAGNTGSYSTTVDITGDRADGHTGLVFGSRTTDVDIYAINDGTLVAEGLAVAVSAGNSQNNWAFDGNVSVNWLDTTTSASVDGITFGQSGSTGLSYDQAAWSGETQVTGGTGFGLTTSAGNGNVTLGLIFAVADLDNTVTSSLSHANIIGANTVDVRALGSLTQVTTAVSAQIALGNTAGSFSGAAASADLSNRVSATLSDASIELADDNARVQVAARDSDDEENKAFDAITEKSWYPDAADELTNTQFYKEVGLITQTDANKNPTTDNPTMVSDFLDDSNMTQTTVVVSAGIAPEDSSGSAGVLVNRIDNNFSTDSNNVTVSAASGTDETQYLQSAEANVVSVGVVAGVAGSGGDNSVHFSAAGSVLVSNVTQSATSAVNDLTTKGVDTATIQAGNSAVTVNVAGNVGVSVGGDGAIAAGGSVVVMNTNNAAEIDAEDVNVNNGSLVMTAQNEADAWAASADGAISSSMSFGGAVAVNRVKNTATIALNNATLKNAPSATLHALDDSVLWTLAGNVAVGAGEKGAGVSGAVAYSISGREDSPGTSVTVDGLTVTGESVAATLAVPTDIDVKAQAIDHVSTLVISAGITQGRVGFAGAAGVNEIKRNTTASVHNLTSSDVIVDEEQSGVSSLGDVTIEAQEDADIDNLSLTAAFGNTAGVGLGIAVNRVNNSTSANLTEDEKIAQSQTPDFKANSLTLQALTDNDIDSIGIGGAGGVTGSGAGSVAINLITSDTQTLLENVVGEVDAYGIINAQSDDAIGAYTGNAAGAGSYAAALSVTVNEKKGTTSTTLTDSDIEHTGVIQKTGEVKTGVEDDAINDGVVGEIDVGATLADDRQTQTVGGLYVGATSTETFKTFVINGAGSGSVAGAGTVSVTYHGGDTQTTLTNTNLSSIKDLTVFAGDYVNIDTVSTTVAGSVTAAIPIAVNVMTTEHNTSTTVSGGSLHGELHQTIHVGSEAKEGVSGLAINAGGGMTAAVGALVNVTRELSDVSTTVSDATIEGATYNQTVDYLGRLTTMGLNAAGAVDGAATASVSVNYADNDLTNTLSGSTLFLYTAFNQLSHRRSDWGFIDVNVAGAVYGAANTYVAVNTVEGTTDTTFDNNDLTGRSPLVPDVTIESGNTENYDATEVNVAGSMYASMAANVIVNRYYGDAKLYVNASDITADDLTFKAYQNRFLNETSVTASASLGTIGANVIATFVGDYVEPGETPESFWDTEDLKGIGTIVGDYVNTYGSSSSAENPGVLGDILTQGEDYLSDEDKASIVGAAATAAQASETASGTTLTVNNTKVNASTVSITAEEDTADGAGVDITVGSGQGGLAALAASVATLRYNHNANVRLTSSNIAATYGGTIGAKIDGDHNLTVWQVSGTLASGTAAYADAAINGQAQLTVEQSTLTTQEKDRTLELLSRNDSTNALYANGVIISGISGGGIVTDLRDTSDVLMDLVGLTAYGNLAVEAIRAQSLTAESMVGQGGLANGMGGLAEISDSGSVKVTLDAVRHDSVSSDSDQDEDKWNASLIVKANDATQSRVKGYGAQGSALGFGIVEATLNKSGSTDVTLQDNTFANDSVTITAAGGIDGENDDEAMRLTAITESYGGAIIGSLLFNKASVNNTHAVNLTVKDGGYSSSSMNLQALGHVIYDVTADSGSGGVLQIGNNRASVNHAVNVSTTLDNLGQTRALTANVVNSEEASVVANSAGGGVLLIEDSGEDISPAYTQHTNASQTTLTVKGELATDEDLFLAAETVIDARFKADNSQGGVAGGSGANLVNSNTTTTKVIFDKASTVAAGGKLTAKALTTSALSSANGYYAVDSGVYGGFMGSEIRVQNTENNTTQVQLSDSAQVRSVDDMTLEAKLNRSTDLRTRARTAGVVNGATAYNTHVITSATSVDIGQGKAKVTGVEKTLTMASSADEFIHAEAVGDLQGGLVGGAGAHVNLTFTRDNAVNIGKGAQVDSSGDLRLFAGRDASGENASLNLTTYAHAYGKGLISGTDVVLDDPMTLRDHVNVAGEAKARNDIEVVAFSGDVNTTEMARYYHWSTTSDAAETYDISSSAAGTKSGNLTEDNAVTVDGSLLAGFATSSDITISGVYLPEGDDGLTVSTDHPFTVTQTGEEATIEYGTEDLANVYWSRHEEIQSLLAEYGATDDAETRQMMLALKAEDAYLLQMMKDKGFITSDGQYVGSQERGYVTIKDLTVSGGNIAFTTDAVKGGASGVIEAHSADHITIDNQSNLALHLENVFIAQKGGNVTLNDETMSGSSGFAGTLRSESDAADPTMSVTSRYTGPSTVEVTQNGKVSQESVFADTSLTLNGLLGNRAGDLSISVTGDISLTSEATVSAAGNLTMGASGSVMQSYSDGIYNVSGEGSVESLWKDKVDSVSNEWKDDFVDKGNTTSNTWTDNSDRANTGAIVAGGDVFIAGETINLNGTVQSGFAEYGLSLDEAELSEKIAGIIENWKNAGSPEAFDVKSSAYQIVQGGYELNDKGQYVWKVGAWYDPLNDRVVIDDITPQGGHIYLTGKIANTGGGNLIVADGHATVSVDVGGHDLLTGNIDTGNLNGSITITDTAWYVDGQYDAKVTEYTKDDTGALITKTHYLDSNGNEVNASQSNGWSAYSPKEGLLYAWSEGYGTSTVVTKSDSEDFYLWGAIDTNPNEWENTHTEVKENQALSSAGTVGTMNRPGQGEFVAWGEYKDIHQSDWDIHTWTEYHDFLHFSGTAYGEATQTTTQNYLLTFTVKADKDVRVSTLSGTNTISLASDKSVLLGGSVRAQEGKVSIDAGENILNHSGFAAIEGASDITLNAANGSIGTESSAIRINGSTNLALNATAGASIFIDASGLEASGTLTSETLSAKETLSLATGGNLHADKLTGTDISLVAQGDMTLGNVEQYINLDRTQRFDAEARNVTISATTGDLSIGQIKADQSVSITTDNALLDAQDRSDMDTANAEEKINAWIQAGLINEDGSDSAQSRYESDLNAAETEIEQQLAIYHAYLAASDEDKSNMSESQRNYYESIVARFDGYEASDGQNLTVDDVVAKDRTDATSTIGKIEAAYQAGDYGWSQNELLFAIADSIINPDPGATPQADSPNIVAQTIKIDSKAVGSSDGVLTGSFSDFNVNTAEGLKLYEALSRADVGDVVWDFENGTVSVQTKRPIIIEQTGDASRLDVTANDHIYIQSTDDTALRIGQIISNGAVRLVSANGIYGVDADNRVEGLTVTLRGGTGGIGTAETLINLAQGADGWTALSASEGVYVNADGALTLYSASSDTGLFLTSAGLSSYTGAADEEEDFNTDTLGYVSSPVIELTMTGENANVGSAESALRVSVNEGTPVSLTVKAQDSQSSVGDVNISTINDGQLQLSGIDSTGSVQVQADELSVVGGVVASGNVSLITADDMTLVSVTSQNGEINAQSQGAMTATEAITALGEVNLTSADAMTLSSVTSQEGGVSAQSQDTMTATEAITALGDVSLNSAGATTLSSVTSQNGEISAQGQGAMTATGAITASGDVNLTSTDAMTLSSVTSQEGGVDAQSQDTLTASEALAAAKDVNLTSVGDMSVLSVTSQEGAILADSEGALTASGAMSAAGDVSLTSEGDMSFGTLQSASGSISAESTAKLTVADKAMLSALNGTLTLKGEPIQLGDALSVAANGLELNTSDNLTFKDSTLRAGTGGLELTSGGQLAIENSQLSSEGQTELSGAKGVVFEASDLSTSSDDPLSIDGGNADVKLSGLTNEELTALSIAINAAGVIDVGGLTLMSGSDLALAGGELLLTDTTFSSLTGDALAGDLRLSAQSGALDLTQTQGFASKNVIFSALNDIIFAENENVSASETVQIQSQSGSVTLRNGSLSAADLISLAALGGVLDLTGTNNEDGTMALVSGTISLTAQGELSIGDRPVNWQATSGNLTVEVGALDWANDSEVKAAGALSIQAQNRLTLGDGFKAEGTSVSITGGLNGFNLGDRAELTATAGGIDVLGSGNATLGGHLTVNAIDADSPTPANITIGAQGVLSVQGDAFEVTANDGAVAIYGGQGMSIMNDLTVITPLDAQLFTGSGDLTVGNEAVIKAGTASGLAQDTYGTVNITAGENFTIGESATIYADDLNIEAMTGDITFGNDADLWGVTDGVSIKAQQGSIYMGENLSVHSTAAATQFVAQNGDIVIERAGTLQSSANSISFTAGGDVIFKDDFLAQGTSFVIDAQGVVDVRDNAYVHTYFGDSPSEYNRTEISGAQGVSFGDNARFDTTVLGLNAGDSVSGSVGNLTLGDNAHLSTTYLGIVVNATGDVIFGDNATLMTSESNIDRDISLTANGSLSMGEGASINGANRVYVTAREGVALGQSASIVNSAIAGEDSVTFVQSDDNNVVLGDRVVISGQNVVIWATDQDGTQGGSVIFGDDSRIEVDSDTGTFELRAFKDVFVENRFTVQSQSLVTFETITGDIALGEEAKLISGGDLTMNAGRDISLGNGAQIVTSTANPELGHNDVRMTAQDSIRFGDNTRMASDASIYLTAVNGDISFGQSSTVGVQGRIDDGNGLFTISASQGRVTIDDGTNIYGQRQMSVDAGLGITLTGEVWLDSDYLVSLSAQEGDILMQEGVRLGGVDDLTYAPTEKVVLVASGDVRQNQPSGELMGITAGQLTVSAGGDVSLGVLQQNGGNYVSEADIESGGSVILGFSADDTRLSVNQSQSGVVNGDFMLIGENNRIEFVNGDLEVTGDMTVKAQNLSGLQSALAHGDLQLYLTGGDSFAADLLKGQSVGIVTQAGALSVNTIESASSIDVMRLDTQNPATLNISNMKATDRVLVVNGSGEVRLDQISTDSEIWIFAESPSVVQKGQWNSTNSQSAVFSGVDRLIRYLSQSGVFSEASDMLGQRLIPRLTFGMQDLTNASTLIDHSVIDEHDDILNPQGLYFFLLRRTENVDESGLPTRQEPIINNYWAQSFEKGVNVSVQ